MTRPQSIQTSVDPVIFTVFDDKLHILVVRRNIEPYNGCWSLPGGLIDCEEDLDIASAATRKLKEKTNLSGCYLEQVATVGSASRDPRGWSITIVYFALIPRPGEIALTATHGASEVRWEPLNNDGIGIPLAFDHEKLIKMALERLRSKVSYTSVAAHLLDEAFTLLDLQNIHEIILGRKVEKKTLMRRYIGSDLLLKVPENRHEGRMRPAQLYQLKERNKVHYFVRSMEGPREE